MEKKVQEIVKKNSEINSLVSNFFQKDIETVKCYNGKYFFNYPIDKIMDMEMKKILSIYLAEFSEYFTGEKEKEVLATNIKIYESDELDAHGYKGEIAFPSNANRFLERLYNDEIFPITFVQDENGRITYDEQGTYYKLDNVSCIGQNGQNCLILNKDVLENDVNFKDICVYAKLTNMKERDFFLRFMPHELMHSIGFGGGIFEGVTESLTREVCEKYNLTNFSFAHQEETYIFQQIEKIIGRDAIIQNCYLESYNSVEDVQRLNDLLASGMDIKEKEYTDFKKWAYYDNKFFSSIKQGYNKEEQEKTYQNYKEASNNLRENLNRYVSDNEQKLYRLGTNNVELSKEQVLQKQLAYDKVLKLQDIEIEYLKLVVDDPFLGNSSIEEKFKKQCEDIII